MTIAQEKLKTSLRTAIQKWANKQAESEGWEEMDMYVHPDFESDMTDAAWSVLSAMSKQRGYEKDQE